MTLNVDLTKVKDYKNICYNKKKGAGKPNFLNLPYTEITNYLVVGSMSIGIGEITQDNYKEVFARHQFLQKDIIIKKTMNSTGKVMTNVAADLPMTATHL